jgi:hypothetical protein
MANNYTSIKFSYEVARRFKENVSTEYGPISYVFLGNSIPYENESQPPQIEDTTKEEKGIWNTIFAAKKITSIDTEMVIPRSNWHSGRVYKQFDDQKTLEELIVEDNTKPMYVITTNGNVYKCISNYSGSPSNIEPTGNYTTSNGFIQTPDGYVWKYMYNVSFTNKFLTNDWMPVPYFLGDQKYNLSTQNIIDGILSNIEMISVGQNYVDVDKVAVAFNQGSSTIILENIQNVSAGMSVSGIGITTGTYVLSVNNLTNTVFLSNNTTSSGGGSDPSNLISFKTRIVVQGDGNNDEVLNPVIVDGSIIKIDVLSFGTGYTRATVQIFGSGTGATARAIFAPKYGHGFNPAKELGSRYVMVVETMGEVDDPSENGLIDTDISFRQYGIICDPHIYGGVVPVTSNTSNTVISQTYDVTLTAGETDYINGETVYQGTSLQNSTFSGTIHSQNKTENVLKLINTKGTATLGILIKGNTSGSSRPVTLIKNPEFEPYSGSILNVKNIVKVERSEGQTENIKIILQF